MSEIASFINLLVTFILNLAMLFLIITIFGVVVMSIRTMVSNRNPRWDLILFIVSVLMLGLWMLKWYPQQVIESIRVAMEESRPEADLLREEMQRWLPDVPGGEAQPQTTINTDQPAVILATSTPFQSGGGGQGNETMQQPSFPTIVPATRVPPTHVSPTATAVPTYDPHTWNPATPPPTPSGGG